MIKNKAFLILNFLLLVSFACQAQQKIDYSKIAPHPRLLLSEEDTDKVKSAVNLNSDLKQIHNYIIKESSEILRDDVI